MNDQITVTSAELANELRAAPLANRPALSGPEPTLPVGTVGEGDKGEAFEVEVTGTDDVVIGYINAVDLAEAVEAVEADKADDVI